MATLPPLPDDLPEQAREALVVLEALSDDELWRVAESWFPDEEYERFQALRERERSGLLTPDERAALAGLRHEADLLTLRKAYASVLLKWRGHQLPTLSELETAP